MGQLRVLRPVPLWLRLVVAPALDFKPGMVLPVPVQLLALLVGQLVLVQVAPGILSIRLVTWPP